MFPYSSGISLGPWSRLFAVLAVLAVVGAVVVGCSHADTVVQVQVQGGTTGIQHLEAMLTIAGQTRVFMVPAQPRSIALPTSFTVQIDRSVQGQLDVGVVAFDGSNGIIGHGTTSLPALSIGQTNQVVVNLTPGGGDGGTPDGGGADGAQDTSPGDTASGGDGPVDAGMGGSGGAAGASGSGGAGGNGGNGGNGGLGNGGSGTAGSGGGGSGGGGSGTGGSEPVATWVAGVPAGPVAVAVTGTMTAAWTRPTPEYRIWRAMTIALTLPRHHLPKATPTDPTLASPSDFADWRWQLRRRLSTKEELAALIPLTPDEDAAMDAAPGLFRVGITPYYFSLIDRTHPSCPVRMQVIPRSRELVHEEGDLVDPLGEDAHSPATGIFHRYPDRCLLLAVDRCAIYCRHCNRRRLVGQEESPISREDLVQAVAYIRRTPAIRDVLISGGDPLTLSTDRLEEIVAAVRAIPHVEIIRIGTRVSRWCCPCGSTTSCARCCAGTIRSTSTRTSTTRRN